MGRASDSFGVVRGNGARCAGGLREQRQPGHGQHGCPGEDGPNTARPEAVEFHCWNLSMTQPKIGVAGSPEGTGHAGHFINGFPMTHKRLFYERTGASESILPWLPPSSGRLPRRTFRVKAAATRQQVLQN